ncbi:hypothetical protein GF406_20530, partial [candidate division KSB1 bacterium]|nr:hypothetical protein [candidate division KSB1 bacterium]
MKRVLLALLTAVFILPSLVVGVPAPANHNIEFIQTYTANGNTVFEYRVTNSGNPAISHWNLVTCADFDENWIVNSSIGLGLTEFVDPDPSISSPNVTGIKFDQGYENDGQYTVTITLSGTNWSTITTEAYIKAGQNVYGPYSVLGPSCGPDQEPDPVIPIVECLTRNQDGSYTVSFGYNNPNSETINIPLGDDNKIIPAGKDGAQPTSFS